ncbi:MAG: hypothetical protein E7213_09650 [Clostridium sp.]|nr:hypothetical protein [Clostridium sp.]
MKTKSILKLIQKRGGAIITASVIALTTLAIGNVTTYAETIESAQESVEKDTKDFNNGVYFQNESGYRIKSVSTDDTAVKVYGCDLSKTLSDKSTVCLKGNNLTKYDTKGNLQWKKELDSTVCYSTPTYNNLLVDSKDNIIVLGYYEGATNGIYAVYDVNGNRTDYKYGMYVPVPVYRDSVTFDENENLIYQKAPNTSAGSPEAKDPRWGGKELVNIYYIYDRSSHRFTKKSLGLDLRNWYHNTDVISTTDGGRILVGYLQEKDYSFEDYDHYPVLTKINSKNEIVFNLLYSGMVGTKNRSEYGLYPNLYKTADGGLIVRNMANGVYYKIDGTKGNFQAIKVYGTVSGFKSVNGVDYMYGKIGKSILGDMASNIPSSTVYYVIPVGQDLSNGLYFNSNFGRIKNLTSDADGNLEVIFSCKSTEILEGLDSVQGGTSKIISVTLIK